MNQVTVTVEDLALRGGPSYAYRLNVQPVAQDFRLILNSAFVNVPAEGSVAVPVTVQRQGFEDDIQLRVANAPKGLRVEGGYVVAGLPVKDTPQNRNSRGVLILTAEPGETFDSLDLTVEGVGVLRDGSTIVRKAEGPGMIVNVAGASEQGAVDRQRSLTAPWMGLELVTAPTKPSAATLEVTMLDRTRMEEGDQIKFRWKWIRRDATQALPKTGHRRNGGIRRCARDRHATGCAGLVHRHVLDDHDQAHTPVQVRRVHHGQAEPRWRRAGRYRVEANYCKSRRGRSGQC